jgi:hypothetical protein
VIHSISEIAPLNKVGVDLADHRADSASDGGAGPATIATTFDLPAAWMTKPSDGLEPSTPSLSCSILRKWGQLFAEDGK